MGAIYKKYSPFIYPDNYYNTNEKNKQIKQIHKIINSKQKINSNINDIYIKFHIYFNLRKFL